jgi:hypothetical protein
LTDVRTGTIFFLLDVGVADTLTPGLELGDFDDSGKGFEGFRDLIEFICSIE